MPQPHQGHWLVVPSLAPTLSSSFRGLPSPFLVALLPALIAFSRPQAVPGHWQVPLSLQQVAPPLGLFWHWHPLTALSFQLKSLPLVRFAHGHSRVAHGLLPTDSTPRLTAHLLKQSLLRCYRLLFARLRASFRSFRFRSCRLLISSRHPRVAIWHRRSFLFLLKSYRRPSSSTCPNASFHCRPTFLLAPVATPLPYPSIHGLSFSIYVNPDNEDAQSYKLQNRTRLVALRQTR